MRRSLTAATVAAMFLLTGPAAATPPAPPMLLPGHGTVTAAADSHNWIVGARPSEAAAALARRYHARRLLSEGTAYLISRRLARPFAAALKRLGQLAFAEPNWRASRSVFPQDPLFSLQAPMLKAISPQLTPPPVSPTSPLLAINDAQIDATHPEFAGTQLTLANAAAPVTDLHGTAVASVAAAAANGVGMVGVWPGMRILGEPNDLTCAGDAAAVDAADTAGAKVINMSYEGPFCFAEYLATSYAFGDGAVPVAAGGNDFSTGNRIAYPASDPHVLTVAATDPNDQSAFFSSENAGIDMSAPGVNILVAVPPALDADGVQDGYQVDAGTSLSAPIVSAAAAWLQAARPGYAPDQYVDLLRYNSDDLGKPGWDQKFGFGRLNLARALSAKVGPHDYGEPNDDIPWVNGTLYERADTPIFGRRSHRGATSGLIDEWEDPADVYRVWFPARSRLLVTLKPLSGDPELGVWSSHAKTVFSRRARIGLSNRRGRRVESIIVRNSSRHATVGYAAAEDSPRSPLLNAAYVLRVRKLHRR